VKAITCPEAIGSMGDHTREAHKAWKLLLWVHCRSLSNTVLLRSHLQGR
jgi:hypothetical protein